MCGLWRLPHISFLYLESGRNCCAGLDEELSAFAKQKGNKGAKKAPPVESALVDDDDEDLPPPAPPTAPKKAAKKAPKKAAAAKADSGAAAKAAAVKKAALPEDTVDEEDEEEDFEVCLLPCKQWPKLTDTIVIDCTSKWLTGNTSAGYPLHARFILGQPNFGMMPA